jgi:hypothetical protein
MKLLNTSALALAISLSGPIAAYAQTAAPTIPYHHSHVHRFQGPHHYVRHRFLAHNPPPAPAPAPVAATTTAAPQALPFGLAFPHIAPYPDGKGDEDGLSEDENDCNTGCIDGNTSN